MHTPSRLVLIAAITGAAALAPLSAVAPATAAFADGIPTSSTLTVTFDSPTVAEGNPQNVHIDLQEVAGGDPAGLTGRLVVDTTVNGVTSSRVNAVNTQNVVQSLPVDTSTPGSIKVEATFVPKTENGTFEQATGYLVVLGTASLSVLSNTVHAGDSIVAVVDEPAGSDGADGKLEATATGLDLGGCGPAPVSDTSAGCAIVVPKDTPSGEYSVTLTYSESPEYSDATTTTPIQIIGAAKSASTTTSTGKGTTSSQSTSSGSSRSTTTSGTPLSAAGTGASTSGTGSDVTAADDATVTQDATDAPTSQPTESAAPVAASAGSGVAATSTAAARAPISPIMIAIGAAGLVALLLLAVMVVLIVRVARKRTV